MYVASTSPHRTTTASRRLAAPLAACGTLALCLIAPAMAQAATLGFTPQSASPLSVPANSLGAGIGGTEGIAVGDLTDKNGAGGTQSLVVAEPASNQVQIFPGTGTGTYGSPTTLSITDPVAVAIGDVNGDGLNDIVVVSSSTNTVTVLLNGGSGAFTTTAGSNFAQFVLPSTPDPVAVALGDVNGDGKLDVVAADGTGDGISTLLNLGSGGSNTPASSLYSVSNGAPDYGFDGAPSGSDVPTSVAVGNLTGHAKDLDVVTADSTGNNVTSYLNNGSGTLAAGVDTPVTGDPVSVAIGNLRGGTTSDVVVADNNPGAVAVLQNDGSGNLTLQSPTYATGANPSSLALADFNGDGKLDAVTANSGSGTASVLLGNGDDTFGTAQTVYNGLGTDPAGVAVGDLITGNTAPDFVTTDSHPSGGWGDGVSVILNTSLPTATLSASTLGYPTTLNGSTSPQTVTVTNNGPAILKISKIAASSNFSVSPSSLTLLSGAHANVTVTFAPKGSSAYGPLTGTVTLTSNAAASPQTISLSGTATTPAAVLSTQPASDVGDGYAQLNGNALSQGPATFYFEYGTTTAYGNQTLAATLSSSTATQTPSSTIPVNPGQVYHYELVVTNAAGTFYGGDQTFATPPDAPTFAFPRGGTLNLGSVLAHGLRYRVRDDSPARIAVRLLVAVSEAHALGLPVHPAKGSTRARLALATVTVNGVAPGTVVLRLDAADRRALIRHRATSLNVTLSGIPVQNGITGDTGNQNLTLTS